MDNLFSLGNLGFKFKRSRLLYSSLSLISSNQNVVFYQRITGNIFILTRINCNNPGLIPINFPVLIFFTDRSVPSFRSYSFYICILNFFNSLEELHSAIFLYPIHLFLLTFLFTSEYGFFCIRVLFKQIC